MCAHRARWIAGNCTASCIPDTLLRLRDRSWIVDQALTALPPTADDVAALLDVALQETDRHRVNPEEDGAQLHSTPEMLECWCQRLTLLGHRARLATLLASGLAYNAAVWASLRDTPLPIAAERLAMCGRSELLRALLQRHPYALAPTVLDVLGARVGDVDAEAVHQVCAQYVHAPRHGPAVGGAVDWVEGSEAVLQALQDAGQHAATTATEAMCRRVLGWRPPGPVQVCLLGRLLRRCRLLRCCRLLHRLLLLRASTTPNTPTQFATWAVRHAIAIDEATGQLQHSVALLEACYEALLSCDAQDVAAPVADALRAGQLLAHAVVGGMPWDAGLGAFCGLDPAARLGALVHAGVQELRDLLVRLFEEERPRDEALQVCVG